jgi:signal transduction histidine kinase
VVLGRQPGWVTRLVVLTVVALMAVVALTQLRLSAIEHGWPESREARVTAASRRLSGDLRAAFLRTVQLAETAARASDRDQAEAFASLSAAVPNDGPEVGIAVLETTGVPWAWAGRHRLPPEAGGDSIATRSNGYYLLLESRRHSASGRVAVASTLVWAHPAMPQPERSLAELFRRNTGVGLAVYAPGEAPGGPDVFDYEEPTTAGPRLLFSVEPIPPEQGETRRQTLEQSNAIVGLLLLVLLMLVLGWASGALPRYLALAAALWVAIRSPVGAALGFGPLFSPATFFRPILGPFSSSPGLLFLSSALVIVAAVALWRRRLPRHAVSMLLGLASLGTAPYLIRELGRGITPPANGVSMGLWLVWELVLLFTSAALIVIAAALFRGEAKDTVRGWRIRVGLGITLALLATLVGIFIWSPRGGWPPWYTFLWLPALILVAMPAPRLAAITAIALVAGSASALVTWGAVLEGRLEVARRDVARLGVEPDPLALPLLESFADRMTRDPTPGSTTSAALYAQWFGSLAERQGYPAHLAIWSPDGTLQGELSLDSLDLSNRIRQELVRTMPVDSTRIITEVRRSPGVHYVLLARLDSVSVVTLTVGPRTRLVGPSRVSRLLAPEIERSELYHLAISPPTPGLSDEAARQIQWRREGWVVHAEQAVTLPGGERRVHAEVDLRGAVPVLVRGALVVLLDVLVLSLIWGLAELMDGARLRMPGRTTWRGSFRVRLAVALAAFFVVPAVGFAAWSFARLEDEARRSGDLLAMQTLQDPAVMTTGPVLLAQERSRVDEGVRTLSQRLGAELFLYSGGRLVAASAPILQELAVVAPLMDPEVFVTLASRRELETTRDGRGAGLAERVAYRVSQSGPPGGFGTLGTPQLLHQATLEERQLDLALVLLLATLAGLAAALLGARVAAKALSRPVADLRRAALAIGQGQAIPLAMTSPPQEFEPVFGAFERMATDIQQSQDALEAARRRTATVLATVATGVVGLDPNGDVIIANPRASEFLGVSLPAGERFDALLGDEWEPITQAVRTFMTNPSPTGSAAETDIGLSRYSLQLASLGKDPGGVVLALNDITEVSRAERVLAWGEMAHQVAHEIKNPLTPIRLGMQHLRRVYDDRRADFDRTLDETSERILAEIDRLDRIARAFGRFAAPADQVTPLDDVDLTAVASEVLQLYQLAGGGSGAEVRLESEDRASGAARVDEVKEVLLNLLENARNAGARTITVRVRPGAFEVSDDGRGIPVELLPRVFEPRFSATTSGAGLGLAIARRVVESWGGTIELTSAVGKGTTVTVRLAD